MIEVRWKKIEQPNECRPLSTRMPLERALVLFYLEPDALYSPAEAAGSFYPVTSEEYLRARRAYSKLAANNNFEEAYDNTDKNESEPRRWYGSSWLLCLGPEYIYFIAKLMDELEARQKKDPGPYFLDGDKLVRAKPQRTRKKRAQKSKTSNADDKDPKPGSDSESKEPKLDHQTSDPLLETNIMVEEARIFFTTAETEKTVEEPKKTSLETPSTIESSHENNYDQVIEVGEALDPRVSKSKTKVKKTLLAYSFFIVIMATFFGLFKTKPIQDPIEYVLKTAKESPTDVLEALKEIEMTPSDFATKLFLSKKEDPIKWYKMMIEIDKKNEINYLFNISVLYFSAGNFIKAHQELSYLLTRKDIDLKTEVKASYLAGSIHEMLGEKEQALKYLEKCRQKSRSIQDYDMETLCLNELAMLSIANGDLEQAEDYLSESLSYAPQQTKKEELRTRTALLLGLLSLYRSEFDKSKALFKEVYLWKNIDNREIAIVAEALYALNLSLTGDIANAAVHAKLINTYIEENPGCEHRLLGYSNVVWISINQCQQFQTNEAETQHREWAQKHDKAKETILLLDFVKKVGCTTESKPNNQGPTQ